ncbi:MAG: helix-turn-helix domain-containing protein [Clostridiales bacterium]|jgi:predicted transcriptional regulator|nr:helix-turn-helix domain-containing protein [Clostridiales bacterium]
MLKKISLSLTEKDALINVAKTLTSPLRVRILQMLNERSLNIHEIAEKLNIPASTAAINISILENSGLIMTRRQPGVHGHMKLCSRNCDTISINIHESTYNDHNVITVPMPIGQYTDCDVQPPCGLVSEKSSFNADDDPSVFYHQNRGSAQLLWFSRGYVEYRFPATVLSSIDLVSCSISFEACSEAPFYRADWPSDITVWINGREIGTWSCPGDFGDHRGVYNPEWWSDTLTQYGHLKHWQVNRQGSYLDGNHCSGVTLEQLELTGKPYITVRIGIKEGSPRCGGINLFGEKFGDHPQGIHMSFEYGQVKTDED